MAGVTLDGPVGIRWGTQNVTNYRHDQVKLIDLLLQIPPSEGGKKGVWTGALGPEPDGKCPKFLVNAIWDFQEHWRKKGVFKNIDGVVDPGGNTLRQLNNLTPGSGGVVIQDFVCGPDVTQQIARTWTKIQGDFSALTLNQKITACNKILIPFQLGDQLNLIPTNLEELKSRLRSHADIDGWDTLALYQGTSEWLRSPPIYDQATNGPCATPGSKGDPSKPFDPRHEDPDTCSNTVQVAGQCWLNGSVNYGTYGVMVKLCSDFARSSSTFGIPTRFLPVVTAVYSLDWAEMLIKAYKRFGANPEGAVIPIEWTRATFHRGVRGVPLIPGNRPKCKCTCKCSGDQPLAIWDYVWKPHKAMGRSTR